MVVVEVMSDTKRQLVVKVKDNFGITGTHKFDKLWSAHSLTVDEEVESEDVFRFFKESKQLVTTLIREV